MSMRWANAGASSASWASTRTRRATPPAPRAKSRNGTDPTKAAIAPRLAAEIYGLDVLAENVEDEAHNTTRFVVLSKTKQWAAQNVGPTMTTFIFRVRNVPAALYKALGGFATNGVNMTKLESYMVDGEFAATRFLADVDGHPEQPALARALEELRFLLEGSGNSRRLSGERVSRDEYQGVRICGVSGAGAAASGGKLEWPSHTIPTISSAKSCATKSRRTKSMRTRSRSPSWTSCRAPKAMCW